MNSAVSKSKLMLKNISVLILDHASKVHASPEAASSFNLFLWAEVLFFVVLIFVFNYLLSGTRDLEWRWLDETNLTSH